MVNRKWSSDPSVSASVSQTQQAGLKTSNDISKIIIEKVVLDFTDRSAGFGAVPFLFLTYLVPRVVIYINGG